MEKLPLELIEKIGQKLNNHDMNNFCKVYPHTKQIYQHLKKQRQGKWFERNECYISYFPFQWKSKFWMLTLKKFWPWSTIDLKIYSSFETENEKVHFQFQIKPFVDDNFQMMFIELADSVQILLYQPQEYFFFELEFMHLHEIELYFGAEQNSFQKLVLKNYKTEIFTCQQVFRPLLNSFVYMTKGESDWSRNINMKGVVCTGSYWTYISNIQGITRFNDLKKFKTKKETSQFFQLWNNYIFFLDEDWNFFILKIASKISITGYQRIKVIEEHALGKLAISHIMMWNYTLMIFDNIIIQNTHQKQLKWHFDEKLDHETKNRLLMISKHWNFQNLQSKIYGNQIYFVLLDTHHFMIYNRKLNCIGKYDLPDGNQFKNIEISGDHYYVFFEDGRHYKGHLLGKQYDRFPSLIGIIFVIMIIFGYPLYYIFSFIFFEFFTFFKN